MASRKIATVEQPEPEATEASFTEGQLAQIEGMIEALVGKMSKSEVGEATDLYILRYRRGMTGIQTGFIRATTLQKAEAVGTSYCNSMAGCRYINVVRAVIADESILKPGALDEAVA